MPLCAMKMARDAAWQEGWEGSKRAALGEEEKFVGQ